MKAHLLKVLVIEPDHLGIDTGERVLEDANDCLIPHVIESQSVDIGEWDVDNLLNCSDTQAEEVVQMFNTLRPMETAPRNDYILLFGESGYGGTPLRCEVCKWFISWGGWRTYAGDLFTDSGGEPVGWLPLPKAR